jgi:hypothetical protein
MRAVVTLRSAHAGAVMSPADRMLRQLPQRQRRAGEIAAASADVRLRCAVRRADRQVPRQVPRGLEVMVEIMTECQTIEQLEDSDNPRFDKRDVIGQIITITSVRERKSDYGDGAFVVIGFTCDALRNGQFKIGGHAAILPMHLAASGYLPVELVLRHKRTQSGRDFYRWEYPSCHR